VNDRDALVLSLEAAAAGAAIVLAHNVHLSGVRTAYQRKASPIDIVTEVDREAERAIVAVLSRSGVTIVAEEGARVEGSADEIFYVDPLDGTTNFAHGHPFHCVSIGLVRKGAPVVGVVHAPALGVVWSGGPALGAFRRDLVRGTERPLRVSTTATLDDALLTTGFPYDRRTSDDDNLAAHAAMMKAAQGVVRCGSAAIDLALVADGTYDGFWERKLKAWDLAGGAALVLAAGGVVSDPFGGPFVPESGAIVAAGPLLHETLRGRLASYFPKP
jgi:myo-inositol-1(or 4)-monophosphatase